MLHQAIIGRIVPFGANREGAEFSPVVEDKVADVEVSVGGLADAHGSNISNTDVEYPAMSPVKVNSLDWALRLIGYDSDLSTFLLHGFSEGFSLNYDGPREARDAKNLKSVDGLQNIVRQNISTEISAGRVAGPFPTRPLPDLRISPIGLVPKKSPGKFRLIHHLSHPSGESVNDFIDPRICSVQYTSFDEAIFMLQDLGRHCKLFKIDLRNAFRLLPVRHEDFDLLGFMYDGYYFVDKCVPFGCSISCSIFEKFATFLESYIRYMRPQSSLIHYLADFLGGDKSSQDCQASMANFQKCVDELNIPVALEKSEGPAEVLVFLGLELDSNQMIGICLCFSD